MLRSCSLLLMSLVFVACSKKEDKPAPPPPPPPPVVADAAAGSAVDTGSAAAGSGSAMAGSGSADAGSAAAGSGSAAGSAAAGAAVEFEKLSHEDKIKFMKTKVMPAMKPAFQKFDAKEFANFTCKTCHGKDPQKTKYKMPSKDLPPLDFDALKKGEEKEMVEFMNTVVKPEMAKILGEHEMTQAEPHGFGCLECHTEKKKK